MAQCPSVLAIHDDVFIYGKNDRDHDANIINLFNVAQKEGLVLQQQKMCHKTGVRNVLWWSLLLQRDTPQIQRKFKGTSEMAPPPDEARATIVPWSSKLPADICPPSQLEH